MSYEPRIAQYFDAFDQTSGKKAIGCPCVARSIRKTQVDAIDNRGFARSFDRNIWRFEKAAKRKGKSPAQRWAGKGKRRKQDE